MNIAELIEHLSLFDDDLEVVISSDIEGNRFSKVSDIFVLGSYTDGEFEEVPDYDPDNFDDDGEELGEVSVVNSVALFPED